LKKIVIGVVAGLLIVGSVVYMARGCRGVGKPKVSDTSKHWAMLSMAGYYNCPHCGKKVTLTDEELHSAKPPALSCPYCKKAVDIVEVMTGKPRGGAASPAKTP